MARRAVALWGMWLTVASVAGLGIGAAWDAWEQPLPRQASPVVDAPADQPDPVITPCLNYYPADRCLPTDMSGGQSRTAGRETPTPPAPSAEDTGGEVGGREGGPAPVPSPTSAAPAVSDGDEGDGGGRHGAPTPTTTPQPTPDPATTSLRDEQDEPDPCPETTATGTATGEPTPDNEPEPEDELEACGE